MRVSSVSSEESEEERFQLLEFVEKTAVENDDSSTSENFSSFMFEDETFTDKRSSQTQIKHEKCGEYFLVQFIASQENEGKAKRVNKQDVGVIASVVGGGPGHFGQSYTKYYPVYDICRLQTVHCRLHTADRRPQTADRRPQTADCRLQTADCRLQTADRRLQTTDCRL